MYKYGLPHCRWILYQLSHQGSPWNIWNITQSNGISLIHKKGMREYTHTHTHTHTQPPPTSSISIHCQWTQVISTSCLL